MTRRPRKRRASLNNCLKNFSFFLRGKNIERLAARRLRAGLRDKRSDGSKPDARDLRLLLPKKIKILLATTFLLAFALNANASKDSLSLGKTHYIKLPNPDSAYVEVSSKTLQAGKISYEENAVVIPVKTFRIDSLQCVKIRFRKITELDTISLRDTAVCLVFRSSLTPYSKLDFIKKRRTPPAKEMKKSRKFLLYVVAGLILAVLLGLAVKPLRKQYRIYRFKKKIRRLLAEVENIPENLPAKDYVYHIAGVWKNLFSELYHKEFSAMTLSELQEHLPEKYRSNLLEISRAEYEVFYLEKTSVDKEKIKREIISVLENVKENYAEYLF